MSIGDEFINDLSIYEVSADYWKLQNKTKKLLQNDFLFCFAIVKDNHKSLSYKLVSKDGGLSEKFKCGQLIKVFNKQQNKIDWNGHEHFIYSDNSPIIFTAHDDVFYASIGFKINVADVVWVSTSGSETVFKMIDGTEQHVDFGSANELISDLFQKYFEDLCAVNIRDLHVNPDGSIIEWEKNALHMQEFTFKQIGRAVNNEKAFKVIGLQKLYILETFSRYIWIEASKRVVRNQEDHQKILAQAPVYVASLREELGITKLKDIQWKEFYKNLSLNLKKQVTTEIKRVQEDFIEVDGRRYFLNKSPEAIYDQGSSLIKGTGKDGINERAGWALVRVAAERGSTKAKRRIANYIAPSSERIGDDDWQKAMDLLNSAYEAGDIEAMTEIGGMYFMRDDYKSAISSWYTAADAGSVRALERLGSIYYNGVVFHQPMYGKTEYYLEPDFETAERFLLEADEKEGSVDVRRLLAKLYEDWWKLKIGEEGIEYIKKSMHYYSLLPNESVKVASLRNELDHYLELQKQLKQ